MLIVIHNPIKIMKSTLKLDILPAYTVSLHNNRLFILLHIMQCSINSNKTARQNNTILLKVLSSIPCRHNRFLTVLINFHYDVMEGVLLTDILPIHFQIQAFS